MRLFLLLTLVLSGFFVAQGAEASPYYGSSLTARLGNLFTLILYAVFAYPVYVLFAFIPRFFGLTKNENTIRRSYLEIGCFIIFALPLFFLALVSGIFTFKFVGIIIFCMFIPAFLTLLYKVIPSFLEKRGKNGNRLRQFVHDKFFIVYSIVLVLYIIVCLALFSFAI